MREYQIDDVCLLAKRINNTKRNYLLVDPLQGKHMPVSPTKTIELCDRLGQLLVDNTDNVRLVIGFAETATAVGAIAAMSLPDSTVYQHTTREAIDSILQVVFLEEHSHAVMQKLDGSIISEINSGSVIMIDDEISTGKTVVNMITELKHNYPKLNNVDFVVGSIINRMSKNRLKELKNKGISFLSLCYPETDNYCERAGSMSVSEPVNVKTTNNNYKEVFLENKIPKLYNGALVSEMKKFFELINNEVLERLNVQLRSYKSIDVIGTEECMTAAIMLGCYIEKCSEQISVNTHSTTRSPIGISSSLDYPCRNGVIIPSFYEKERVTYIYNIADYDAVIVITDSHDDLQVNNAMSRFAVLFENADIYLIRG